MPDKCPQNNRYGFDFIPSLPTGKNEYWLRNSRQSPKNWRNLNPAEIETLERNDNNCPDWSYVLVCDPFDPTLIRNSSFYGLVRLGKLQDTVLRHHDFSVPAGIRNSALISCDIGDNCAVQDCAYISHYIIGDDCILSRIDEMQTTNHAKFGNGAIKDGEEENVRVWIDVMNEAGGRSILPFESMIAADAFLWAAWRDDAKLTGRLKEITQEQYGGFRGNYGMIGTGSVIKSCAIIKDVEAGCHTYIKGANKLKNLTIHSSVDESTQIGEGVELVNGIVGYGCHIFYGSKAVRFVMGRNCNLKYGARLIHSILGDNSTVSCCEILNNLIFPVHEQHHNNSFLIASLIQGMSNVAAAATIGSNHNSRANDGEIRAGRGFWPGLAVTLKHSSCFASFVIIAKGDYPAELNIPFPFSLVNNNVYKNRLEVRPAWFWIHNLYALERNSWKSRIRDRRVIKVQHIETDYLTPDTVEEIIAALSFLEKRLGEAEISPAVDGDQNLQLIACRDLERSQRKQVIIKPTEAIAAYRRMLRWYAAKTLAVFLDAEPAALGGGALTEKCENAPEGRISAWVNMGGQIVPSFRVDELRRDISTGKYKTWDEIHAVYAHWRKLYPLDKARHAWAVLSWLYRTGNGGGAIDSELLKKEFEAARETSQWICGQIYETRAKDFANPFRKATFRNEAEMEKVLGAVHNEPFVCFSRSEAQSFEKLIARLTNQL